MRNVVVLDENPEGLEGPWVTYARMVTLRTNKALTGEGGGGAVVAAAAAHADADVHYAHDAAAGTCTAEAIQSHEIPHGPEPLPRAGSRCHSGGGNRPLAMNAAIPVFHLSRLGCLTPSPQTPSFQLQSTLGLPPHLSPCPPPQSPPLQALTLVFPA